MARGLATKQDQIAESLINAHGIVAQAADRIAEHLITLVDQRVRARAK